MATSTGVNLPVLWTVLSSEVGALHPQQAEYKAKHAHGQSWHEEASHYLDVAWWWNTMQLWRKITELLDHCGIFQDEQLVTDPPQTRAQGSHSSCWQQWSLWNRISTSWTSTRPPWWWRSPPFPLLRWSSSLPWPWCRRWRSSPEPSAERPKSVLPESSSPRSDFSLKQLSVESNTGSCKRKLHPGVKSFLIQTGDEEMTLARLQGEGVVVGFQGSESLRSLGFP